MAYGDVALVSNNRYTFREAEGDANANLAAMMSPAGGAVRVPVWLAGLRTVIDEIDLGAAGVDFAGQTQPWVGVLDVPGTSTIGLTFSANATPIIETLNAGGAPPPAVTFPETQTRIGGVTSFTPLSDDLASLGTTTLQWADLFLASGGVLAWNNTDRITHTALTLTLSGIATLVGPATLTLFNTATTTLNIAGAATTITVGAATSATTWTGQSVTLTGANSTNNTTLTVANTSNAAAASHAILDVSVGGTTSTGDPQVRLSILGATGGYIALDNSDRDRFFAGFGTTVGAAQWLRVDQGGTQAVGTPSLITFWPQAGSAATAGTDAVVGLGVAAVTVTVTNQTQRTSLFPMFNIAAITIAQSGGVVIADKAAGVAAVGATAGASVTLTHSSAFRALTGGAAVNVSGVYHETQTAGTTGNYQTLYAVSTGARPALADHASVQAIDFADGDTRLMVQAEQGIEIAIGKSTIQPNSATEMAFSVTNEALVVGSEGSVVIPYLSQTGALFTDAIGGDVNGAIGVNYDSDTGPTATLEVRVEGAWLSVAVTGYLIQARTLGGRQGWWHPNQIIGDETVDETVCVVCGERMGEGDSVAMYGNLVMKDSYGRASGLHAVFGHQHLERDSEVVSLKARIETLETRLKALTN